MASGVRKDELDKEDQNGTVDQVTAEDSQTSDNDGGERPVRNKLKETSITSAPKTSSRASSRGRKRSFDEDNEEVNNEDDPGHRRKRSRDSSTEETTAQPDEGHLEQPQDPGSTLKKKRSRDQLDKDESKAEDKGEEAHAMDASSDTGAVAENKAAATEGEPEKKRHRDDSQERDPAPLPSAFANTSSVSPFGAIGTSTSKPAEDAKPATSSSAFASSSLAAFASSEQSPFGSLGASTPSFLKSSTESTPAETEKQAATGFAAAAKPSGFATLGSGFSGFSSGFGAASSSSGLTSFAAPGGPGVLGSTSSKPFGAEADEDEEDDKEEEGESGPAEFAEDKTDERFFEREIETGEEEEKTYFACKAKLFHFSDKEWKERGLGNFKVNVKVTDGVEDKKSARMVMRADGVLRVMLNTALFKGMKVGDATGNEPKSKQIHLASLEGNRSVPLLLRTGSEDQAKDLYHTLQDLLKHL